MLSRQALEGLFLRAGVKVPQPWAVVDSPSTAVQLAASRIGIAMVPEAMAAAEQRVGHIRRLSVLQTPSHVMAALVYRTNRQDDPLIEHLRRAAGLPAQRG
jgi:DNA-binding transcriptional LysR family regulator